MLLFVETNGEPMPEHAMHELAAVLDAARSPGELQDLLEALLTPKERARLARRWQLVCLLAAGVDQRTIARQLGLSLCNITRGSRELKRRPLFRRQVLRWTESRIQTIPRQVERRTRKTP